MAQNRQKKKQVKVKQSRQTRVYLGFIGPRTGTMRFGPMAGLVGCALDLVLECTFFWLQTDLVYLFLDDSLFCFALFPIPVSIDSARFGVTYDTSFFGANVGGGAAELLQNKKCNRAKPGDEKRVSRGFGAHLLTHKYRRESVEHGSCARNASVPSP